MLVTLSDQLYILCTCGITGFFVLSRLYGREDKDRLPGIGSSVVCGLVVLTAYAGYFSLFSGVGLAANIILIGNGKKETTFLHSILLKKELNVFGSRNSYARDFQAVIDLIASGKVNVLDMVSAVYPVDDAADAFKALAENDGSLAKVLIEF